MKEGSNINLHLEVLTPCAKKVYLALKGNLLNISEIQERTNYSSRSIRSALNLLLQLDLINKKHDFYDLRRHYFEGK